MVDHRIFPLPIVPVVGTRARRAWMAGPAGGSGGQGLQPVEEGIWRRTQDPSNASLSGWVSAEESRRRRVVHYRNAYEMDGDQLSMSWAYLQLSVRYPKGETLDLLARLNERLVENSWAGRFRDGEGSWRRWDLLVRQRLFDCHPYDVKCGDLPDTGPPFLSLEVTLFAGEVPRGEVDPRLPWAVLASGFRTPDVRGAPRLLEHLGDIPRPFHVEVGCGLAVEAGIPALHSLHELYYVTQADGAFVLSGPEDHLFDCIAADPEGAFRARAEMYKRCVIVDPSPAHLALGQLVAAGEAIGPVFNNNFDGLLDRSGVPELCVRRYDEIVPSVSFNPRARALLVIGCHADRRRIQARARAADLRVVFLDPEGFVTPDGGFSPYPIEGCKDGDFLRRARAAEGLLELAAEL